jgi:hypothetical protein
MTPNAYHKALTRAALRLTIWRAANPESDDYCEMAEDAAVGGYTSREYEEMLWRDLARALYYVQTSEAV